MFEIIVLIIVVLIALIIGGWVTHQRNQRLANSFEQELESTDPRDRAEFHQRFDAVFEQLQDNAATTENAEPFITLEDNETQTTQSTQETVTVHTTTDASDPLVEPEWDLVIALTVMAPKGRLFTGRAIKNALDNQDLHFGEMQIYHRYHAGNRKQPVFSAANIIDPGTFLPAELISMKTPGLLLFARLPGPINGMAIFDALMDAAEGIAEQLDGIICDDNRSPLEEAKVETLRSQIFELNLSLQKDRPDYDDFR